MVNRSNRGFASPTLDLRAGVSPDVYAAHTPAADLGALGQVADQLGEAVTNLAAKAAAKEGQAAAAADIEAGGVTPRNIGTVRGDAYDQVAKSHLGAQTKAAISNVMTQAYVDHPDNPDELAKALAAARKGVPATGFTDLDVDLSNHFTLQSADFMARATVGARKRLEDQDRAAFDQDLSNGQALLDQMASGASVDAAGAQRVALAGNQYLATLAKYGPKEAFSFAGVDFAADDARRDALTPAQLSAVALKGMAQAKSTWITTQAETLPDAAARSRFAGLIHQRWQDGDPAFQGLDGADMDRIGNQIEAGASRAATDERAARAQAASDARDGIEAFRWGKDVDWTDIAAKAHASGDVGLAAQADFFASASVETRGVLRTVVARQLGLMGDEDAAGVAWVDATGAPADGGAMLVGEVQADPAGFFGRVLGGKVIVTSGERGLEHNAKVGGSKTSDHPKGRAWDIKVPGETTAQTAARLKASGVPYDQIIDEGDHVHIGLGARMRGQFRNGQGAWSVPHGVAPGSPAYAAWASAREGFTTDPLNFARGGKNRGPIANVPVLVPEGAFDEGPAGAAWSAALQVRRAIGTSLSRGYGVPPRMLTNGEKAFYAAQIEADPMQGVALAMRATEAVGADGAMALMRELGESAPEASATLHIADLASGGSATFAKAAAAGMVLRSDGQKADPDEARALDTSFEKAAGGVPAPVLTAARAVAQSAMIYDQANGVKRSASYYLNSALGATSRGGRVYGGPAMVNDKITVLPRWMAADGVEDTLRELGALWDDRATGPVWSNGEAVSGDQLARMRLALQPSGRYRFVNPKTGNPLMKRGGGVFEADLDKTRDYVAQKLGAAGARPGG